MDSIKQQKVFNQYIDQYQPIINLTLDALRANKNRLRIPYAQFLFSVIDYYGLLYTVATKGHFKKRDPQNFKGFFASVYFPSIDRCKASFLYFIRNGLIHQVFPKASSVGTSSLDKLFIKDLKNGDIPKLNLDYLDQITIRAVDNFINDLQTKTDYIDNLFDLLITNNYGFNDHLELEKEIKTSYGEDINKVFDECS